MRALTFTPTPTTVAPVAIDARQDLLATLAGADLNHVPSVSCLATTLVSMCQVIQGTAAAAAMNAHQVKRAMTANAQTFVVSTNASATACVSMC